MRYALQGRYSISHDKLPTNMRPVRGGPVLHHGLREAGMKRLDVGDTEVRWEWTGELPTVLEVTPHFEGAEIPTPDEIIEAIMDHVADIREAI